ncbi:MAG: protein kinase [Kofleriaceae bacterium]|nr:protein kinase [Kofleriaceae bacterium]
MPEADEPLPPLPERFERARPLGAGTYGQVLAADDAERGPVAVKVLRRTGGDALRRFKDEFRALAAIVHPNLVVHHELLATGERWLLVMERVDGDDLVTWVTRRRADAAATVATAEAGDTFATADTAGAGPPAARDRPAPPPPRPPAPRHLDDAAVARARRRRPARRRPARPPATPAACAATSSRRTCSSSAPAAAWSSCSTSASSPTSRRRRAGRRWARRRTCRPSRRRAPLTRSQRLVRGRRHPVSSA